MVFYSVLLGFYGVHLEFVVFVVKIELEQKYLSKKGTGSAFLFFFGGGGLGAVPIIFF